MLARLRGFLAGSNQISELSAGSGSAGGDDPAAEGAVAAFASRDALAAVRERVSEKLQRGHVLCWLDFPPRQAQGLFFYSPVAAIAVGGAARSSAGAGGVVGDDACESGVDATARAVLELLGSFDAIHNFAASFDDAIAREKARAEKAGARERARARGGPFWFLCVR